MTPTFHINHRSKYGAKKTQYRGRWYASKREADHAAHLDLMKQAKGGDRVTDWTPQVRIPIKVRSDVPPHREVLICHYVVDFFVTYGDGHSEYHEVKGFETDAWILKRKLFEALYPNMKLVVVR